jgi:cellulose biosynthesis protein BcsQ
MHTIVLATQKGGSGKSTLSIGLALAAIADGHAVRMIETDLDMSADQVPTLWIPTPADADSATFVS